MAGTAGEAQTRTGTARAETARADGRPSILITGAASGIGLATARHFAERGWFVGMADIDERGLAEASRLVGPERSLVIPLDVRDRGQWAEAVARMGGATGGRLKVLLNNAGLARYGWFEEVSPQEAELQLDVNVKGAINGTYAALPLLKATPGSRLINVASCAGLYGSPKLAVYCATKFAIRGLSEALDVEFSRFGVRVACVMPWFVETPILNSGSAGSNETLRDAIQAGGHPVCTVEDAAGVIWTAAHGRELHYIVGKMGERLRFAARFFPGRVRRQLKSSVQPG